MLLGAAAAGLAETDAEGGIGHEEVDLCGEIAGDPNLAPLLLGLGVDELSTAPAGVAQIKYMIRRLKLTEAQELATFALGCGSPSEIYARCELLARADAPSLFENKT